LVDGHSEGYEEIDLWELFMVLIKRFKLIAALFLVAVITAVIFNFFIFSPVYQSSLVLALPSGGKVGTNADGYLELAQSPATFRRIKDTLGFAENVDILRRHFKVELQRKVENGRPISEFIKVTVSAEAPELPVAYCNAWLEAFDHEVLFFMEEKLTREKSLAAQVLKQRTEELAQAEEELGAFDRNNPISLKENELRVLENELVQGEQTLRELQMAIPTDEARLKFLEETLAKEKETLTGNVGGTVYPDSSAAGVTSANVTILNPVYLNISQDLATTRARLVANQEKAKLLVKKNEDIQKKIEETREKIVSWKLERERLVRNETEAKRLYDEARGEYEAYLQTESNLLSLAKSRVVVEPALPQRPVGPRKLFNTALAGILGLFAGVMTAFFVEWVTQEKKRRQFGQNVSKSVF